MLAVLIPVFNDVEGLKTTLSSLDVDPYPFEVYVVDDGSEPAINMRKCDYLHTIKVIRLGKNSGIEKALNIGLNSILEDDFQYISRIDAGDVHMQGRFDAQIAALEKDKSLGLVGGYVEVINKKGELIFVDKPPTSWEDLTTYFHYNNYIYHPAVTLKAELVKEAGNYSDKYPAAEDYEYFRRCMRFSKACNIPRIVLRYVVSEGQISGHRRKRQVVSRLLVQLQYFDIKNIHSYLGVMKSAIALIVPRGVILYAKRHIKKRP